MALEKGDVFTVDTNAIYEALGNPERMDDDDELHVSVRRIAGPDTITTIKHVEPGMDWTDVQYITVPIPKDSIFYAAWDEPVTLLRKSR